MLFIAICTQNDKVEVDTAEDIPVDTAEETDTAAQDDTAQDGDTQEPDVIQNTDFPELQDEFNELYGSAIPPDSRHGEHHHLCCIFRRDGSVLELQIMIGTLGQNVTCPTIDGEFAPDGSPVASTWSLETVAPVKRETYSGTMVWS